MSTLVSPLISGISGAESGTANFYVYGTNYQTPAIAYDVDGEALGTSVTLDANGGAECYVYERVQVLVEDVDGASVRTFALQSDDASSLVSSASITGTDPETGSQVAGGEILTRSALDRMYASFGALDFKVRVTGGAADQYLKDAITQATDNFFNVTATAYGAVGDDVADDTLAIQAAVDAAVTAGGGTVYFPAGTYYHTGITVTSPKVRFRGDGHRASILSNHSTTTNSITISSGGVTSCGIIIEGLGIVANSTSTGIAVHASAATGLEVRNCRLDLHLVGVKADTRVRVEGCDISTMTTGVAYCVQFASAGTSDLSEIIGCSLTMASTAANGTAVLVQRSEIRVQNCLIDTSAGAATSVGVRINHASGTFSSISGNRFAAGASNYGIYVSENVSFGENGGNRASSGTLFGASGTLTTANGQQRLSRQGTTNSHSQAGGTYLLDQDIKTHFVICTTGALTISCNSGTPTHGQRLVIDVAMSVASGGGNVTFSTGFSTTGVYVAQSASTWGTWEFVYNATTTKWAVAGAGPIISPHTA